MVDNTPFAPFGLNQTLLCPADLISPWRVAGVHGPPKVQEIPDSGLQTLVEAKRIMTIKQDKMTEILWEETRTEVERYKPGNLKLGKKQKSPQPTCDYRRSGDDGARRKAPLPRSGGGNNSKRRSDPL